MYSDARWAQNLSVREFRPLPEKVLPCLKREKLPDWSCREEFKEVKPGYFYHHDLEAVRAELF